MKAIRTTEVLGLEKHAVRFVHATGAIFSEPLAITSAMKLADYLRTCGAQAVKILPASLSDVQPIFDQAGFADRQALFIPGIGQVAFAREQVDVVLPDGDSPAAPEYDWQPDDEVELTDAGLRQALGAEVDARLSQENLQRDLPAGEQLLTAEPVGWACWTLLVMTGRALLQIAGQAWYSVTVRVHPSPRPSPTGRGGKEEAPCSPE